MRGRQNVMRLTEAIWTNYYQAHHDHALTVDRITVARSGELAYIFGAATWSGRVGS